MPTFLYHETIPCLVTFVRRVEEENYTAAEEAAFDGGGDLLGVSIGDTIPSVEEHHLLADEPHNIPAHFYQEPVEPEPTDQWWTVWVAERSGQGTHFVQAFEAYSVEDAKRQAVAECAECWGYDQDEVEVLGVVAGDAKVIEWNDEGEDS